MGVIGRTPSFGAASHSRDFSLLDILEKQRQPLNSNNNNFSPSHRPQMDIANQLFSLTLGVEPNKHTLQSLASTLNSAGEFPVTRLAASLCIVACKS